MRVRNVVMACALAGAAACESNPAPRDWLPRPQETPTWTYGGWIALELKALGDDPKAPAPVRAGELLAVAPDSVWLMTDDGALAVARADVTLATLIGWDPETDKMVLWTTIGTVSTLSNGAFLLLTAPAWIIGGSLSTASQSRRPVVRTDKADWSQLNLYARFPQGLPPGLDITTLGKLVR
jgi:hypothetical protein